MVKMMGLYPLSEGAPVGLSVAGTLGVADFSELGIGLPFCIIRDLKRTRRRRKRERHLKM